jgi:hypothetical protein
MCKCTQETNSRQKKFFEEAGRRAQGAWCKKYNVGYMAKSACCRLKVVNRWLLSNKIFLKKETFLAVVTEVLSLLPG